MKLDEFLELYPEFTREMYKKEKLEWEFFNNQNTVFQYSVYDDSEKYNYKRFWVDKDTEEVFLEKPEGWTIAPTPTTPFEFLPANMPSLEERLAAYGIEIEEMETIEEKAVLTIARENDNNL